jgi:hypothetical protein
LGRACRTVVFQRRTVRVSTGLRWRGHFRILHQAELALPDGFLEASGPTDAAAVASLAARLREAVPAGPRHMPVWVALPDALADVVIYPLQRGLSVRAAQAVITGRLQRELAWAHAPRLTVQRLTRGTPQDLWLAAAMNADLHGRVEGALREAGLAPWSTRPAALWHIDPLLRFCASGESAALACVDGDGTSVVFWDAAGCVRWCHARWDDHQTDTASRATAIRRICLQYVQADAAHHLQTLHVLVHDAAAAQLADELDQGLETPCQRHLPPAGVCVTASAMAGGGWVCSPPSIPVAV